MIQYPPYDQQEFNCLISGTKGLRDIWGLMSSESELEKIRDEMHRCLHQKPSFDQAKKRIEQEVSGIVGSPEKEDSVSLGILIKEIQAECRRELQSKPLADYRIKAIVDNIMEIYSSFDVARFSEDFESFVTEEKSSNGQEVTAEDNIKELQGQAKKVSSHIKKNWPATKMHEHFHFVPNEWKDRRISEKFSRADMAMHILKYVMREWVRRSHEFSVPITPNCVAILTLPEELAEKWMELRKEITDLEGKSLIRNGSQRYMYYDAGKRGKSVQKNESLPGMFK